MSPIPFSQFIKRIPIKAPAKAIYEAWASQQGLESWFLREALFTTIEGALRSKTQLIAAGDHYTWKWHGYEDSTPEKSEILVANGWDTLSFGFSGGCKVHVTILTESGEAICELRQDMPMDDKDRRLQFFIECGNGWTFYLANLKSVLEGGLDLRNKNTELKAVLNS
jgi:hypothetical protein